jgi:TPR repeat protein
MRILLALLVALSFATPAATQPDRGFRKRGSKDFSKERRFALIIGNQAYKDAPLRNTVNDARLMSARLKQLDFEVMVVTNADRRAMKRAIRDFTDKLKQEQGVGLFYFSGHGAQVRGVNYLLPLDAPIRQESDIPIEAVDAGEVLERMKEAGNGLNIVILDACRNNPFARSFRSAKQGLATMNAGKGAFIAYATAPGSVASDGSGSNGTYTEALAEALLEPGLKIEEVFKRTRARVIDETAGQQLPWDASVLVGDFYFIPQPKQRVDEGIATAMPTTEACLSGRATKGCAMVGYGLAHSAYADASEALRAADVLTRGCNSGDAAACSEVGTLFVNGTGVAKDPVRGVSYLRRGCDGGDARGCFALGLADEHDRAARFKRAATLSESACGRGSARDCATYGRALRYGAGIAKQPARALKPLGVACDAGIIEACSALGFLLYSGDDGVVVDYLRAALALGRACDGKIGEACRLLGHQLKDGNGVAKDDAAAYQKFTKACELGDDNGCFYQAFLVSDGTGTTQDIGLARDLLRPLCERDDPDACHNLAVAYVRLDDENRALAAYQRACELGSESGCSRADAIRAEPEASSGSSAAAPAAPAVAARSNEEVTGLFIDFFAIGDDVPDLAWRGAYEEIMASATSRAAGKGIRVAPSTVVAEVNRAGCASGSCEMEALERGYNGYVLCGIKVVEDEEGESAYEAACSLTRGNGDSDATGYTLKPSAPMSSVRKTLVRAGTSVLNEILDAPEGGYPSAAADVVEPNNDIDDDGYLPPRSSDYESARVDRLMAELRNEGMEVSGQERKWRTLLAQLSSDCRDGEKEACHRYEALREQVLANPERKSAAENLLLSCGASAGLMLGICTLPLAGVVVFFGLPLMLGTAAWVPIAGALGGAGFAILGVISGVTGAAVGLNTCLSIGAMIDDDELPSDARMYRPAPERLETEQALRDSFKSRRVASSDTFRY